MGEELDHLLKSFIDLKDEAIQHYKDAKILASYDIVLKIESLVKNEVLDDLPLIRDKIKAIYSEYEIIFTLIKQEYDEVSNLMKSFAVDEGWERIEVAEDGSRIMFKRNTDSPLCTVRMDGTIDAGVFNVLAVLLEIDYYKKWIPCALGVGLKNVDVLCDIDRDMAIYGYGVDLIEDNKVMAVVRSYESNAGQTSVDELAQLHHYEKLFKGGYQTPHETSKFVRADIKEGGFLLTCVDENTTNVSFLFTIDPKMSYIPSTLINWAMKFVASYALKSLKSTAQGVHEDESYTNRMEVKADVYAYLKKRLEDVMTQMAQEPESKM